MPDREVLLQLAVTRIDELRLQIKNAKKGITTTSSSSKNKTKTKTEPQEDDGIPPAINCDEVGVKQENSNDNTKS